VDYLFILRAAKIGRRCV